MLETIWSSVVNFEVFTLTGLVVYVIPAAMCLIGYIFTAFELYKYDVSRCTTAHYSATLTIGWILGRLIVSFIPIINLTIAVFHFLPYFLRDLFDTFGKMFSFPIVRHKYDESNDQKLDNRERRFSRPIDN